MTAGLIKTWHAFLDILFPPICLSCRSHLASDEERENLLCAVCFNGIKIYSNIVRTNPVRSRAHTQTSATSNGTGSIFSLIAVGPYENTALRELIHHFKYNGFLAAQVPLEKLILKWLDANSSLVSSILDSSFCLIPIPLHRARLRKRGFNQAEIIGQILSRRLNLPMEKNLLERVRDTKSQIKMIGVEKREENVKNSIKLKEGGRKTLAEYQNVILVDDIYTSGATMREAAGVLRRSGAKNIIGFAMAKT